MQNYFCSEHGNIDYLYNHTCDLCNATMNTRNNFYPKLSNTQRIVDGQFQELKNGKWANPFNERLARWQ